MIGFLQGLELSIGIYFVVCIIWSYLLIILATQQIWWDRKEDKEELEEWPDISILVPMYNEEVVILDTLEALFSMGYPGSLQVCVADDASTDSSFRYILDQYRLGDDNGTNVHDSYLENLKVVRREENGGRAAALNSAFDVATGKYVVSTDADTIIDPEGLKKIITKMELDTDLEAVGGSILLSNNKEIKKGKLRTKVGSNPLVGTQIVEYIRSFIFGRMGLNKLGHNIIVSGAFGVFRKKTIERLGKWSEEALAEDLDMTIKVRNGGGKVLFIPDPVAWTEAPSNLKSLGNQRDRWYRGLTQALWKHKGSVMQLEDKGLSFLALPYYFFVEWLSPIIQVIGILVILAHLIWFGFNWPFILLIMGVAYIFVVGLSMWSIVLEQQYFNRYETTKDTLKMVLFSLIEPFWYGPLHVYWRLRGLFKYLVLRDKGWGTMKRTGIKIGIFLALLLPAPLVAQEFNHVESYIYSEHPQIDRTEWVSAVSFSITTLTYRQAWYNDLRDDQIRAGVWYDYKKTVGINGYVAGSIDETRMIANHIQHWNIYGVIGNFVIQTGFEKSYFEEEDLLQFNQRIEYYINDSRIDFTLSHIPEKDIAWVGGRYHHQAENFEYAIFAVGGKELLDFPYLIESTAAIGTMFYIPSGPWSIRPGLTIGSRNDILYSGLTIGVRYTFDG